MMPFAPPLELSGLSRTVQPSANWFPRETLLASDIDLKEVSREILWRALKLGIRRHEDGDGNFFAVDGKRGNPRMSEKEAYSFTVWSYSYFLQDAFII